jgi:hypothetical protein
MHVLYIFSDEKKEYIQLLAYKKVNETLLIISIFNSSIDLKLIATLIHVKMVANVRHLQQVHFMIVPV